MPLKILENGSHQFAFAARTRYIILYKSKF